MARAANAALGLWSRQPQGPVRLARTSLAQGLVDAALPQGGFIIPVSRGGRNQPYTNTSAPGWAYHSRFGNVQDYGNSGGAKNAVRSAVSPPFSASSGTSLKECSILFVARTSATVGNTLFWGGYGLSSSANPIFALGTSSAGKSSFFVRDTAGTGTQSTAGATTISANTDYLAIGTRSEAANFHRIYLNGATDLDTTCSAISTVSFDRSTLGGLTRNSFSNVLGGQVALMLVWNRALTPSEAAALSTNPWQVFEYKRFPRVGAGTSIVSGVGASAGTSTVSGIGASTSAQVGSASGSAVASGIGASTNAQVGSATGTSTTSGIGASINAQVGNAAGTSDAQAISAVTLEGVGSAVGTSIALGVMGDASLDTQSSGGKGGYGDGDLYYYKKRKKAPLPERAQEVVEAFEKLQALVPDDASVALEKAERKAELAVEKLEARKEIGDGVAALVAEVERAVEIFQSRLRRQAEEDEEEEIALIMAALQD